MAFSSNKIIWGLSDIKDGPMKYDFTNQQNFFEKINLEDKKIIGADLVHGDKVVMIDSKTPERMIPDCDALITNDKNCLLTITVADCLPIYFYDRQKQVVALAHAGWKGIINGIAKKTVQLLINNFDCNSTDIKIFIGPHIQKCHFEVKDDVANQFASKYLIETGDKKYINLADAVKDKLIETGVSPANISVSADCTFCLKDTYFSFRRERDKIIKAMIAYIGLK
ncbi:MAG: peptidoglycan editing factor PgeF [Candidatus Falkowbacteria bacterium]|nr:MAG: peptidoglycan editing factor PgeF [Candidatus Falkowbacteria bacterium]